MGTGDPYSVPQPGDRLSIPADVWRRLLATNRYVEDLRASQKNDLVRLNRSPGIVQVRNDSGSDRNRGEVLGIDDVFPDPSDNLTGFKNRPILHGSTPDIADHIGKFVVLTAPLADGAIGPAVIDGLTYAKVDVTDEDHSFADVDDGDAGALESYSSGGAQIIFKPSGTGIKNCLVRLGPAAQPWRRFELKEDLAISSSAIAYILDSTATRTADEFVVHDLLGIFSGDGSTESGMDGSNEGTGAKGYCRWWSDGKKWEVKQMNC